MSYHVSPQHRRNVVSLLGLGFETVSDGVDQDPALAPVIALEYAPFGTLAELYSSSSFLASYQKKLWILSDIADGLQALHLSSVVHGDVKPENILIFPDKDRGIKAKISDFGYSMIDPAAGPEFQTLPGYSTVYAAPEAVRPIRVDELEYTDVYSFGIVMWQTLLGG
ncbi:kinase-like domain-containing protein, partial [Lasiosphaeria ovina]